MSSWLGGGKKSAADELEAIRAEIASISGRVSNLAGSAGDGLRSNIAQLRASLPAGNDIQRAASDAYDQGVQWVESAGSEVRGGVREARAAVQDHPATSIAIAAGVGFLVGLLICRSSDR